MKLKRILGGLLLFVALYFVLALLQAEWIEAELQQGSSVAMIAVVVLTVEITLLLLAAGVGFGTWLLIKD